MTTAEQIVERLDRIIAIGEAIGKHFQIRLPARPPLSPEVRAKNEKDLLEEGKRARAKMLTDEHSDFPSSTTTREKFWSEGGS